MTLAAVLLASQACGSDAGAPAANDAAPVNKELKKAEPVDLHELLIPAGPDHPAVGDIIEAPFKEAATKGLLAPPAGMIFTPDSCVNFIEMGDPSTLDGWMQFNEASPVGKDHNLAHEDFFVNVVIELPGGVDVDKIKATALACSAGVITLDWQGSKVTGALINTETHAPALDGATTFAMEQRISFEPVSDPASKAVLKQFYSDYDGTGGVLRVKQLIVVGIGDILYLVNVQDPKFATEMAVSFYEKAVNAGLTATG